MRRCLRLIDAGASVEHALGEAYNAGHVDGSDVKRFTEAETDLLEGIALLSDSDVAALTSRFPTIADLVLGVRVEAEHVFDQQNEGLHS